MADTDTPTPSDVLVRLKRIDNEILTTLADDIVSSGQALPPAYVTKKLEGLEFVFPVSKDLVLLLQDEANNPIVSERTSTVTYLLRSGTLAPTHRSKILSSMFEDGYRLNDGQLRILEQNIADSRTDRVKSIWSDVLFRHEIELSVDHEREAQREREREAAAAREGAEKWLTDTLINHLQTEEGRGEILLENNYDLWKGWIDNTAQTLGEDNHYVVTSRELLESTLRDALIEQEALSHSDDSTVVPAIDGVEEPVSQEVGPDPLELLDQELEAAAAAALDDDENLIPDFLRSDLSASATDTVVEDIDPVSEEPVVELEPEVQEPAIEPVVDEAPLTSGLTEDQALFVIDLNLKIAIQGDADPDKSYFYTVLDDETRAQTSDFLSSLAEENLGLISPTYKLIQESQVPVEQRTETRRFLAEVVSGPIKLGNTETYAESRLAAIQTLGWSTVKLLPHPEKSDVNFVGGLHARLSDSSLDSLKDFVRTTREQLTAAGGSEDQVFQHGLTVGETRVLVATAEEFLSAYDAGLKIEIAREAEQAAQAEVSPSARPEGRNVGPHGSGRDTFGLVGDIPEVKPTSPHSDYPRPVDEGGERPVTDLPR